MMNLCNLDEIRTRSAVYFYNMDTNLNTTGKRIRFLRETVNNWNGIKFRQELKKRTGEEIKPSTLTNHEKDTSMPSYSTLVNYAIVLGTTTDYLLLVTEDSIPTNKTDRNVLIEVNGEEERRILEEIGTLLEELNVGDLRFVLDIIRRVSATATVPMRRVETPDIEHLIKSILVVIEQVAGPLVAKQTLIELDNSLSSTPSMRATWRRFRPKRTDQGT